MMDSALTPTWPGLNDWRERWLHLSGRLRPGVTPERVAVVLEVTYRRLLEEDFNSVRVRFSAEWRAACIGTPLEVPPAAKGRSQLRTDFSVSLLALMAMVAVVLLIARVNVANLPDGVVQRHRAFHQLTPALPGAAVGHPERDLTHDGAVQELRANACSAALKKRQVLRATCETLNA
jgi:hypothetical protein